MFDILTTTQRKVLELTSIGLSAKEISDKIGATTNTVNTHLKNIKERLELQKVSELTAYYWCELFGTSLDEQRRSILTSAMCLIFLFTLPIDNEDKRRYRLRFRKGETEMVADYTTL